MSYSNPMHHSTPSPWAIESRPTGGFDIDADYEGERERVAFAVNPSNAALIAAAPDLLAALQALLPHVPGYQSGDSAGRPWLDQALAAIAKAAP